MFKSFITPNAIDIFIQPETGPYNEGIAQGYIFPLYFLFPPLTYFNDAVLIGGKIKGVTCLDSYLLSHEIGHVLGLFHTFESTAFGVEYVNGSNCSFTGDIICDTKASQNINWDLNLVDDGLCQYIGSDTDVNGDLYDPDPKNIMEYSSLNCTEYFTSEQGARMRGLLASEPDLQKLVVPDVSFP